ncbi:1-acyl-sn-glycerol-3-phosphate acyltransferase [Leptospira sp. 85282-16]|nr:MULTISPECIES: 1-acyl-sn-glycerol-3-phosphate acyltransferase [Leptospira]MCT8335077.1 1-acyl-sn-glycerol-3-phosphate acyltransferase [Leptospira sp. 85282-16]
MRRTLAFLILLIVTFLSKVFYKGHFRWLDPIPKNPWKQIRLIVFLNHTSLYEVVYSKILPFSYLWHLSGHFKIPGADTTLKRPIVGTFLKLLIPNLYSVSRKNDETWDLYLQSLKPTDIVMITPEGRMKRPTGFDKFGKPMTVRAGVADIMEKMDDGMMLLCLSGGLHHVQAPGQFFPKLFKNIHMNFSYIDIKSYKAQFPESKRERKLAIVQDLQRRLETDCPK